VPNYPKMGKRLQKPAQTKKFNYVYITTNLINGKQYIGDHSSDMPNDGYLGSGRLIAKAIKKHGKENFKKEILENFPTKDQSFNAQEKYIKEYNTLNPKGYNIHLKGGWDPFLILDSPIRSEKYLESLKGVHYSPSEDPVIHIPFKHVQR
jgi:hypothetical protein